MPTALLLAASAAVLILGVLAFRLGLRILFGRDVNSRGSRDNLAVTMLTIGIILVGWSGAGLTYVLVW